MAEVRSWRGPVLALVLHVAAASAAAWTLVAAARRRPAPPPPDPVYPVALALMEAVPARAAAAAPASAALAEPEPAAIDPLPAISMPALSEEPSALPAPVGAVVVATVGAGAELFIAGAAPRRRAVALPAGGAVGTASAPAGAGWAAQPLRQDPPAYPRAARRAGREGTVVLRLAVAGSGAVDEADVAVSSGSADLDQAACAAARRWRFAPPAAHGLPGAVVRLAVEFRLRS